MKFGPIPVEALAKVRPDRDMIATIGVFDGVHKGHQRLFARVRETAAARGCYSAAILLHPPPRSVLAPDKRVPLLTQIEERMALVSALGIDLVISLTFTLDLSRLTAREFISLLKRDLRLAGLVVGPDFALGRGREGNVEVLRSLGQEMGFDVQTIEMLVLEQGRISSTAVREAVAQGDVRRAWEMLGHPFVVEGPIVSGNERGRVLGFPTANVAVSPERALPADGIYATRAYVNGDAYLSATYIGTRPTFGETVRHVEAFLLDFQGEIYGKEMRLEMVDRIRGDKRFESPSELVAQIQRDVERARHILSETRADNGSS